MKSVTFFLLSASVTVTAVSCGSHSDSGLASQAAGEYSRLNGISVDSLLKWTDYAESAGEGLWTDDPSRDLFYSVTGILGSEEDLVPPFYNALYIHTVHDTLLVADQSTQELVCMLPSGEVLWKVGEEGEGPGHFHGIGTITSGTDWICVANTGLNRVDLFAKNGEFTHTLSVEAPEDLISLTDSTLIVLSETQQGGDIHILHVDSGLVRSFGELEQDEEMVLEMHFYDNLRGCLAADDLLAVVSRYEHKLYIFDLTSEECLYQGRRELPSEPCQPYESFNEELGNYTAIMFPSVGGVFTGQDGMISIVVDEYMNDGSLLHSSREANHAPVTVIDRYNSAGEYLNSYCLPDSGLSWVRCMDNGDLVARQQSTGEIRLYSPMCIQ